MDFEVHSLKHFFAILDQLELGSVTSENAKLGGVRIGSLQGIRHAAAQVLDAIVPQLLENISCVHKSLSLSNESIPVPADKCHR